jgi:5-oxoprolinase (ATP-hydrolysing) subunit A
VRTSIDLNCDLGEFPDGVERDEELCAIVSSINVACGGHAGDEHTMAQAVRMAKRFGVALGAHPSYPDRADFGRVEMTLPADAIADEVERQTRALANAATREAVRLTHVKPHGALYHAAMHNEDIANAVADGAARVDPGFTLVGLAGAPGVTAWRRRGVRVLAEAFADRRYRADGSLAPRSQPGAVIDDPAVAAQQALRIALRGEVATIDGKPIDCRAETLCVHSDSPSAVETARHVRTALESAGVRVVSAAL